MKYYAVKKGLNPGVYTSWAECETNVKGVAGAIYKSFKSLEEAEAFVTGSEISPVQKSNDETSDNNFPDTYAFVDGSFNPDTKTYGYGGFLMHGNDRFVLQGSDDHPETAQMRNVAGEICGAMAAVRKAQELGLDKLTIFYDYQGIEAWASGKWKCNKTDTIAYKNFVNNCGIEINFQKVAAHTGIPGNEEADRLAKEAVGI